MLRSGSTYASSPAHPPTCAFRREAHRVPVTASRPSKWHPSRSTLGENDTPFASRVDANKERSPPHATVAVFLIAKPFLSAARRKKSEYAFAFPRGASAMFVASSPTARTSTTWSCATCSSTFPSPPYVPGASRSASRFTTRDRSSRRAPARDAANALRRFGNGREGVPYASSAWTRSPSGATCVSQYRNAVDTSENVTPSLLSATLAKKHGDPKSCVAIGG